MLIASGVIAGLIPSFGVTAHQTVCFGPVAECWIVTKRLLWGNNSDLVDAKVSCMDQIRHWWKLISRLKKCRFEPCRDH